MAKFRIRAKPQTVITQFDRCVSTFTQSPSSHVLIGGGTTCQTPLQIVFVCLFACFFFLFLAHSYRSTVWVGTFFAVSVALTQLQSFCFTLFCFVLCVSRRERSCGERTVVPVASLKGNFDNVHNWGMFVLAASCFLFIYFV